MADIEQKRIKAICEAAHVKEIDDVSDGFHTFKELYYQRMMLFAALVRQNRDRAWKSLRHEDGELCFGGGWFIVGIDTVEGSYTYHYEDNFYSLFDCIELERGKHWDGHTEKDVTRLLSLEQESCEDTISRQAVINAIANTCFWLSSDNWQELIKCISSIPPVNSQKSFDIETYCKEVIECLEYQNDMFFGGQSEALTVAIEAIKQINKIKKIISSDIYIQEDVIRYKMICEVLKEH